MSFTGLGDDRSRQAEQFIKAKDAFVQKAKEKVMGPDANIGQNDMPVSPVRKVMLRKVSEVPKAPMKGVPKFLAQHQGSLKSGERSGNLSEKRAGEEFKLPVDLEDLMDGSDIVFNAESTSAFHWLVRVAGVVLLGLRKYRQLEEESRKKVDWERRGRFEEAEGRRFAGK